MVLLVVDIVFDHEFVQAHSRDKITSRPQTAWGKVLGLLFQPGAALALQQLDCIGYRILGRDEDGHMNVLIANVPGSGNQAFPTADGLEYSFQLCFDILVLQYLAAIPRGPDQVVLAAPGAMRQLIQSTVAQDKSPPFFWG